MIELKIIPDGASNVPVEARDHGILASHLEANVDIPSQANAPITDWRGVRRVVDGSGDQIRLRLPGEPTDYPDGVLSAVASAVTANINGVKEHPDGWQYVGQG